MQTIESHIRKPEWLKISLPKGEKFSLLSSLVKQHHLHTICTSGRCPNIGECWTRGTATFMILGGTCTRNCRFCNVEHGIPESPDQDEPEKVAQSVKIMELKHVVITSVTRDDLPDGGAQHWAETIKAIKTMNPGITIETLIPDFEGNTSYIDLVIKARPNIISHNLETVERLTSQIRSKANYRRSLDVLKYLVSKGVNAKSGIMVGLGETEEEVLQVMDDLLEAGVKIITIGQYLQPSTQHIAVNKYITPYQFKKFKNEGLKKGFLHVESAPLVRSSYHAEEHL